MHVIGKYTFLGSLGYKDFTYNAKDYWGATIFRVGKINNVGCNKISGLFNTLKKNMKGRILYYYLTNHLFFYYYSESVKPGLAWGKQAKKNKQEDKQREAAVKHRSKFKPVKEREHEQRLQGLNKAISSDNKGFAMLQKMGYKQGMGLGKTGMLFNICICSACYKTRKDHLVGHSLFL